MAFGNVILGGLLLGAAYTDITRRQIPNWLIGLGLGAFAMMAPALCILQKADLMISCLLAGGLAFSIHLIPYMYKLLGAGDVKLAMIVGLLLGWQGWLDYLGSFCLVSVLVSLWLFLLGKRKPKTLPMAPLMAVAYTFHQILPFIGWRIL